MSSTAANKPSELEAQFTGETRTADGYQYWTTSQEDEEALDIRADVEAGIEPKKVKPPRKKLFKPGIGKRTFIRLVSLLLLLIVASAAFFAFNYTRVSDASETDTTQPADAIIVLGAAQYNGSPSYVLQERLDHAFNLYRDETLHNDDVAPLIFTTGAGADGDVTTEGLVGFEHLLGKGVPESDIVLIPEGTNTWEQLSASLFQLQERDLESVLLVSDGYHNYRMLKIADELGMQAFVSPSAVEATKPDLFRETAAVSIARITGYRRLSNFTE